MAKYLKYFTEIRACSFLQKNYMLPCEKFYYVLFISVTGIYPRYWKTCHFLLYNLQAKYYSSPEPRLLFRFLGDPPLGEPFGDLSGKKKP